MSLFEKKFVIVQKKKPFGLWSAVFLGIGSMIGAGIFVLLGQAGAITGNLVWLSFIFGGIIALLTGYSFYKLALRYPSRGGIIEYLTQCYGENLFSGSVSILFYLGMLVSIAMVAKTFGYYLSAAFSHITTTTVNFSAIGIILFFMFINLSGSFLTAKFENIIVFIKLTTLILFTIVTLFFIKSSYLSFSKALPIKYSFFAIGLTFFAYVGFSVITNTIEDMENPHKTLPRAMFIAIISVMLLYVFVSIAVFGTLTLKQIIAAKDYVLAVASKSFFGDLGFSIMTFIALLATSSSINANLYAVTNIAYTMAKEGELPKEYTFNVWHNNEGLIISSIILIILVLLFNLSEIAMIGSLIILLIYIFVHVGHLKNIKETGASAFFLISAIISIILVIALAIYYIITSHELNKTIIIYFVGSFIVSFLFEFLLRLTTNRVVKKQTN